MIDKQCPACNRILVIWHATQYRTFRPEDLTAEKQEELRQWLEEVYMPKLGEIWDTIPEDGTDPNVCPHCQTEIVYVNWPVAKVRIKE